MEKSEELTPSWTRLKGLRDDAAGLSFAKGMRRCRNFIEYAGMETEIKASLMSLLAAIKVSNAQMIATEMARLDDFAARGRLSLHPQLLHFLERRSYAKAAMFLGGESDIPVGVCGGKAGRSAVEGER